MQGVIKQNKGVVDTKLRDEQAGFRKGRSSTDHIATLRIIVEQSVEWQSSAYICFVDFQKAFDGIQRELCRSCLDTMVFLQRLLTSSESSMKNLKHNLYTMAD